MIFTPVNEHCKPSAEVKKHYKTYSGITIGIAKVSTNRKMKIDSNIFSPGETI